MLQALGAPMSQGLSQQAQAALTQGMALAAQQQGMGMGALGQQQGGLQGMSQVYGQQPAAAGSLQQQGQQAGLQAVLANFQQQQLQQQQAQGGQQQPPTPGQQRGPEAQQQQQRQALAEQAGRAHQAMVVALSSQQLGAGNLQTQQQQQQELWQEEHQQQGFLQLHQGMRDAEAGEAAPESAPHTLGLWFMGRDNCMPSRSACATFAALNCLRLSCCTLLGFVVPLKCSMHAHTSDSTLLWPPLQPV